MTPKNKKHNDSHNWIEELLNNDDYYKVGPHRSTKTENATDNNQLREWIGTILQSEHLSLLVGNGLSIATERSAEDLTSGIELKNYLSKPPDSETDAKKLYDGAIKNLEQLPLKDESTLEYSLQQVLKLIHGLEVISPGEAEIWKEVVEKAINQLVLDITTMEKEAQEKYSNKENSAKSPKGISLLSGFLLAFANRPSTRDRLNIFTTNYDRLIEYGCDKAGIRLLDRFIGTIEPVFSSTRLNLDMHYNPPGIKEEPRYLHGVVRLTKLHGSLDWKSDRDRIIKSPIAFGDTSYKANDKENIIIYPNPAKDMDSVHYPYSELFRDFAAAVCRPNSFLIIYGYGFGDHHINRIIGDMLRIRTTHLLIIHYGEKESRTNLLEFIESNNFNQQISVMVGEEYARIDSLIQKYMPSPPLNSYNNVVPDNRTRTDNIGEPQ